MQAHNSHMRAEVKVEGKPRSEYVKYHRSYLYILVTRIYIDDKHDGYSEIIMLST